MKKHKGTGFTLLEMLIVMGVIALLAGLIVPRAMSGSDRYTLSASAREIASALRYARSLAIESHTDKAVTFNLSGLSYKIQDENKTNKLESGVELEVFTAETEVNGTSASIRFYPDGASSGGRITLSYEEEIKVVDIIWMTGQVNILASDDG